MTMNKRLSQLLSASILILAVGATIAGPTAPFPHGPHLEEIDECGTCHKAGDDGEMGYDKLICADCHDDNSVYQDFEKAEFPILAFPHALHVEAGDCADCHKAPGMRFPKGKKACDACHAENDIAIPGAACVKCHGKPARKLLPLDHKGSWGVGHGAASRWRVFERHGRDCSTCHEANACQTCHQEQRPRSHSGLWRLRTHGTAASWNRDSCRTCHETGACVACHRNTAPMNHIGAWSKLHGFTARTRSDSSCTTCHSGGECASCHSGK